VRTVTIVLNIPDGVEVRVNGAVPVGSGPVPLPQPATTQPAARPVLVRANGAQAGRNGSCPRHHAPWRLVPAGVSKRSGRPYGEFWACPEPGCDERP
jgi:hypothetical protein